MNANGRQCSAPTLQGDMEFRRLGRLEKCTDRKGARLELGCGFAELEAILDRPLNHKLRLTGVLDIGSKGSKHQELCFVRECLREFDAGKMVRRSDEELAELIFGKKQPLVFAICCYRALNCKHDHFYGLAADGVIPLARKSVQRRGPNGSAVVEWAALVGFIKERRIA